MKQTDVSRRFKQRGIRKKKVNIMRYHDKKPISDRQREDVTARALVIAAGSLGKVLVAVDETGIKMGTMQQFAFHNPNKNVAVDNDIYQTKGTKIFLAVCAEHGVLC